MLLFGVDILRVDNWSNLLFLSVKIVGSRRGGSEKIYRVLLLDELLSF